MGFRELLARDRTLSEKQLDRLEAHYQLLQRWNQKLNLTRIDGLEETVRFHYCESIVMAQSLPPGPLRIADVGSGAGFPGIPLAIYRPDCSVFLIESNQRKAVFLREASAGIANVVTLANRAESVDDRYDWAVSRGVRPMDVLGLRLATSFALLTTLGDLKNLPSPTSVTKLPWGEQRVLAMFHVEHDRIDQTHG